MSLSEVALPETRCKTAMPGERSQDGVCNKYNSNNSCDNDTLNNKNNNNSTKSKSVEEKESEYSTLQFAPCAEMCSVWEREYPLVRYLYHRQPITHLLYSKRAHRYFSASSDGLVKMWKPDYHSLDSFGKPVIVHEKNLLRTRAEILSMTLSPVSVGSAEVLLVMCNDGTITLIRTVSGEVLRTLLGIRTNNINDAKAIYERHPFRRQSKTNSRHCTSNIHKNNENIDNKCDTVASNNASREGEKDINKQLQEELTMHASSSKTIRKREMSKMTNRERERELVQMSKVEARVLPYTIRAYHHDTVELCFGRSNKYFQGLPIVAPTYEHLIQPVYHTADLLFDYGKLVTTHSKHCHSRIWHNNNSSDNSNKEVKAEEERKNLNKECHHVHSRQENWFATAIAITYHTSDGRHQNDVHCNNTIHAQHKSNANTPCVEHDSIEARCNNNNNTQSQTENSFMTSSEWKDGVYLFLGFADGLLQVYHLNEKWFSTSHLSSTRVDPPVAFYPVASLLVHEAMNDHSSLLEPSRCNESAITMIVISESPESPPSSETSVKQTNSGNDNGSNEALRDDYIHQQEQHHQQHNNSDKNSSEIADITFHQLVFIGCKDNTISVRHFDRLHVPLIILGNYSSNIKSKGSLLPSSSSLNGIPNTSRRIVGKTNNAKSRNMQNRTSRSNAKTRSHHIFGLSGHTKPITCYAWSNALELLVTGGRDYMLYFWSPRTSRPVRSIDCRAAHINDHNNNDNKQDLMRTNHHSTNLNLCNIKDNDNKTDHTDNCNTNANYDNNHDTMTLQKHFVVYGFPINLSFVARETNKTVTNEKHKRKMSENKEGPLIWLLMLDNRHVIRIYDAADGTCLHTLLNQNELAINTFTTPQHYHEQRRKEAEEENSQNYKAKNLSCEKSLNFWSSSNNDDDKHTDEKELSLPLLQTSKNADIALESSMSSSCSNQTSTTSQEYSKQHSAHKFNKWQTTNTHALLAICYDTEFERLLLGGYCINVWNTIERVENKNTSKTKEHHRKENTRLDEEIVNEMPYYNSGNKSEQVLLQHKLSHYGEHYDNNTHDYYEEEEEDLFNGTLPALVPPLRKRQTERWISSIHADMNGAVNIALPLPSSASHFHTTINTTHKETSLANNVHIEDTNMTSSYSNTIEYTDDTAANHNIIGNVDSITLHKENNSGSTTKIVKTNSSHISMNAEQAKEHESTITERFTDETSKPDKSTFTSSPTPSFDFLNEVKESNTNKPTEHYEYRHTSNSQPHCFSVNYRSVFNTQRVTSANNERQRRLGVGDVYRFTNNIMDDFDMNALNNANPITHNTSSTPGDAFNATDHTSCTKLPHMFHNMQHEKEEKSNVANNGDSKVDELGGDNNNYNNDNEDDDGMREGAAVVMHNAYLHRRRQEALQQIMKIARDDIDSVTEHKLSKNNICGKMGHKKNATNDSKKKNDSYNKSNSSGIKKANRHMTLEERLLRFTIHDSHIRHHNHAKHGKLLKQHRHAGLIKSKMKPYEVRRAIEAGLIHLASFTDFSDTGTSTVFFGAEKEITKNKYGNQTSHAIISQSFVRDALRQRGDKTRMQIKNAHVAEHDTAALQHPEQSLHTEENAFLEHADKYTSSLNDVAEKWLTSHSPISSFVECKPTSAHGVDDALSSECLHKNSNTEEEESEQQNIEESTLYKGNKDDKECDWYTRREMAAERRRHAAALWHPARVMHTLMEWNVEPIPQSSSTCLWEESSSEDEEEEEEEKIKPDEINQAQGQHQMVQTPRKEKQVDVPHFLPKLLTHFSNEESVKYSPEHEITCCNVNADMPFTENQMLTSRIPFSWEQEMNGAYAISGKHTNNNAAAATRENVALMLAEAEVERIEQQIENKFLEKRKVNDEELEEEEEMEEGEKDEHMEEKAVTHRNDADSTTSFKKGKGDAYDNTTIPSILPYKNGKNRKAIRIETFGQLKERINKKIDLPGGVCKPRTKFLVR